MLSWLKIDSDCGVYVRPYPSGILHPPRGMARTLTKTSRVCAASAAATLPRLLALLMLVVPIPSHACLDPEIPQVQPMVVNGCCQFRKTPMLKPTKPSQIPSPGHTVVWPACCPPVIMKNLYKERGRRVEGERV